MPNPVEADIIQEIIARRRQGTSVAQIVEMLNTRGARRRNGEMWTIRQVRAILSRRELYERGKIHYGEVRSRTRFRLLLKSMKFCGSEMIDNERFGASMWKLIET